MQKERRGFTLIELLAVIVILAIIALIAVPVIMNVITKARKSAFEDSVYGIVKAGEMYYTNKLLDSEGMPGNKEFTITNGAFVGDALEVSGSLPSSGKVTVTKEGKVAVALSNGEYCVRKATTESSLKAEKLSDLNGVCDYKKVANTVFTKATGETSVPACITNNTTCTAGTGVAIKVNDSQTYDFYVMSEDASEGTITLIMNQNLGETVAWANETDYGCGEIGDYCSTNDKGPITALNYLESQTSSWTNIPSKTYTLTDDNSTPKYTSMTRTARARMITYTEATGLGCEDMQDSTCPTWLYENTGSSFGNYGYWTSSANADNSILAWYVRDDGYTFDGPSSGVDVDCYPGVRPVITVSKTIL